MTGEKNYLQGKTRCRYAEKALPALLLLAVSLSVTASSIFAGTVAYREAGLEMEIPEGLILEIHNGFLTVVDTDRTMTLRITLSSLQVVEQFFGPNSV